MQGIFINNNPTFDVQKLLALKPREINSLEIVYNQKSISILGEFGKNGIIIVDTNEVVEIQNTVSNSSPRPVEVSIWFRSDPVVTSEGYLAYRDFTKDVRKGQIKLMHEIFMRGYDMPPKPPEP